MVTNADNLPRVNTTINDGNLRIAPPVPGNKITLLGTTTSTALDIREVIVIDNAASAIQSLRHTNGTPSELSLGLAEAIAAGARNIEVMKIATNSGELYQDTGTAYKPWQRYDDLANAYEVLLNQPVDIVVPLGAHLDATGANTGTDPFSNTRYGYGKQLANFCYQSTKEFNTAFGVIGVKPVLELLRQHSLLAAPTVQTGTWFNTPSLTQVKEWVTFTSTDSGQLMNDYISGSQEESAGTISTVYTGSWQALGEGTSDAGVDAVDDNGLWVDAGQYISVVAAPNRFVGTEAKTLALKNGLTNVNYVNTNGVVGYAAKLAELDPHDAATNKVIAGQQPARGLSPSQAKTLLQSRFVSYIVKPRGFVVTSAISGAHNAGTYTRSDFVRVTTVRIAHAVADVVRERGEIFIGKPINGPFLSALKTEIDSALARVVRTGAIRSFDFSIVSSPDQQVLGEVDLRMSIVPAFELVTINSIISLTKGEGIA